MSLRRSRIAAAATAMLAVPALLVGCANSSPSPSDGNQLSGQVIWADFGGPTNESRQVAYFDGFAEETGVEVVSTPIEDAIYYPMLEGKAGDYDTFQVSMRDVIGYPDHMLEIPADAQGDMVPEELRPHVLGGFYIGIGQGWLTETFPGDSGPQDWVDFFDTEKFPGKRAWPGAPSFFDSSFEIALLADGVAPEDLYPLDIDRAVAKLDSIRDHLIFYQSYPEVQQLLSSGSAAIAVTVTGQFSALMNEGFDVTIQWNQAFQVLNGFVVPEQSNNPEAVMALASWINDPVNQAVFVERTLYGPVNSATFDQLSDEVAANVVNAPSHDNLLDWDDAWRAENNDLLIGTYTEWLAG